MSRLLAYYRLIGAIWILFMHFSWLWVGNFFVRNKSARTKRIRMRWARHTVRHLGLRVAWHGTAPEHTAIYMCNHRSLLDPLIIGAYLHAYPLSKAEVGKYPLLGNAAKYTGIILVERDKSASRNAAVDAIRDHLLRKISVLIFPEGTTSDEPGTLPFKPGVFRLACEIQIPVVPMALVYTDREQHWIAGSLLKHFLNSLSKRRARVDVFIGPAMKDDNYETLMNSCRSWINQKIIQANSSSE